MKKYRIISLLLLIIILGSKNNLLYSQAEGDNNFKIGLGISLFNFGDFDYEHNRTFFNSFYVPIDLNNKIRIEPRFGIGISQKKSWASDIELVMELGLFWKKPIEKYHLLYGIRFGYIEGTYDWIVAPTIGGEYFLNNNFSVGAEVSLKGYFNDTYYSLGSSTHAQLRFYF